MDFNCKYILFDLSMIIPTEYILSGMVEAYLLSDLYMISQQIACHRLRQPTLKPPKSHSKDVHGIVRLCLLRLFRNIAQRVGNPSPYLVTTVK